LCVSSASIMLSHLFPPLMGVWSIIPPPGDEYGIHLLPHLSSHTRFNEVSQVPPPHHDLLGPCTPFPPPLPFISPCKLIFPGYILLGSLHPFISFFDARALKYPSTNICNFFRPFLLYNFRPFVPPLGQSHTYTLWFPSGTISEVLNQNVGIFPLPPVSCFFSPTFFPNAYFNQGSLDIAFTCFPPHPIFKMMCFFSCFPFLVPTRLVFFSPPSVTSRTQLQGPFFFQVDMMGSLFFIFVFLSLRSSPYS